MDRSKGTSLPQGVEHDTPSRTVMQGSVAHGVDAGYEERDVVFVPLFMAAAILGVVVVVSMIGLGIGMRVLQAEMAKPAEVPSLVFATPQIPPEPRVIPNVIDAQKRKGEPLLMPIDEGRLWREVEHKQSEEHKLRDPETGFAVIPEEAIAHAMRTAGGGATPPAATPRPAMDGTRYDMPSEASGGLRGENRLR